MSKVEETPVNIAPVALSATEEQSIAGRDHVFDVKDLAIRYGGNLALGGVSLPVYENFVTAFIGPSGCGKSTFIRCLNRMNDLIPSAVVEGTVLYHGQDLYGP